MKPVPLDTGLSLQHALVVDDSTSSREILRRMLERAGIIVTTANDGNKAVALVQANPRRFDYIFMDLVMDELDGIEAIRQIRSLLGEHPCKIVPMTATVLPQQQADADEAGASAPILRKPARWQDVAETVLSDAALPTSAAAAQATADPVPGLPNAVSGVDVRGAYERCCGDLPMLTNMLAELRDSAPVLIGAARVHLRELEFDRLHKALHKLKGDVLNVGMTGFGQEISWLETLFAAEARSIAQHEDPNNTDVRGITRGFMRYDVRMLDLGKKIAEAAGLALEALPRTLGPEARSAQASVPGPTGEFSEFVARLVRRDARALPATQSPARLLPSRYSVAEDEAFRRRLGQLDLNGALALLQPEDRPAPDAEPAAEPGGSRILVVDDAAFDVRILCNALDGMGEVRFALSGEEAFDIARAWVPDLVISDVNMPGLSGIQLCRQLQAVPELSQCVVILISADGAVATEVEGLTAGAADFIEKPINPARVVGRVTTQLSAKHRRAGLAGLYGTAAADMSLALLTCEMSGKILEVSPALCKLLERREGELIGEQLGALFRVRYGPPIEHALASAGSSGRIGPLDASIVALPFTATPVRISGRMMPGGTGRVFWISVEDMRNQILDERQRLNQQVSRIVGTLTGGIAHEFNNLLGIIIGSLDLALDAGDPAAMRRQITKAAEAAERASLISRRLGDSARGVGTTGMQRADLDVLLDQAWPLLTNASSKQISLVRVRSEEPLPVHLDVKALVQPLLRLIDNASEAAPVDDVITILTHRTTDRDAEGREREFAALEVLDRGRGMDEDTRARAFDPFFTTRGPGHAGLGLSEVMGFAMRQGGTAELDSVPGEGTVVRLQFPIAAGDEVAKVSADDQ